MDDVYMQPVNTKDLIKEYEEICDVKPLKPPPGIRILPAIPGSEAPKVDDQYEEVPVVRVENKYEDVPLQNVPEKSPPARSILWRHLSVKSAKSSNGKAACCDWFWWQWLTLIAYIIIAIGVVVLFVLHFRSLQNNGPVAQPRTDLPNSQDPKVNAPIGPPGPPGPSGPAGRPGYRGYPGLPGVRGPSGFPGHPASGGGGGAGQVGATGFTGPAGRPGKAGIKGSRGVRGDMGATGPQGRNGTDSSTGPPGPQGPPGVQGRPGSSRLNDECERSNGGCEQICIDTYDSYYCTCNTGYRLVTPTQTSCSSATQTMRCRSTFHGYMCWCDDTNRDPQLAPINGTQCAWRNDLCQNTLCEQTCTSGGPLSPVKCSCNSGFSLNRDGYTCSDINECQGNPCVSGQTCINSYGSYYCLDP